MHGDFQSSPLPVIDIGDSWGVRYVDRRKGQRYLAACFYKGVRDHAGVEAWVNENPKLKLVDRTPF